MTNVHKRGFLILDRKGEYIKDTIDQRGNTVPGLHKHPMAPLTMVIVSKRNFNQLKECGTIHDYLPAQFNIRDIEPIDLADFLPGLTQPQAELIRDYAHIPGFYDKLLVETQFGAVDNRNWYENFPGLFDLKDSGKKMLKKFEEQARLSGRDQMTDEEKTQLQTELSGTKAAVLERAAGRIKRFCLNPFFGNNARGRAILEAPSSVEKILQHLENGKFVFIDMQGQHDDDYTLIAALFARKLLNENKARADEKHIRAAIVMEEAHNILSEDELTKGNGTGSVFIELAREGRSNKLGFVLVTQQPDARSIAPQVVKTIDTVVAFNMPPEDAKHLQRIKSAFGGLELEISNAAEFQGVAVADAGAVLFQSCPVDVEFMTRSADRKLADAVEAQGDGPFSATTTEPNKTQQTVEDRLQLLMRQRQESIKKIALDTMRVWQGTEPHSNGEQIE